MRNLISIPIVCILLSACSSSPIDPEEFAGQFTDRFTTQIKGKEIKLFTYTARLATSTERNLDEGLPHSQRVNRRKQDARSYAREQARREEQREAWEENVQLGLDKTLAMTGYCRTGYIELSRYVVTDRAEIRGECNEGATEQDIQKFAD
ncbi:hypothetical protein [Shewanella maritima]|uniref:hypothetical protein n=1 Tax=Shewanella maritima TaxID=2520507 RepID=UPI0037350637